SKRPAKDRKHPSNITIEGTEGLLVNYAKCCYPIPDDRIIGTTTADRGLVIHRLRCHNARGVMKHPDQFFYLNWSDNTQGYFNAMIKLEARNQPGVLSEITNTIAAHESNINKLNVEEQAGNTSRMSFVIEVRNRKQLADIMRELRLNDSVIRVNRPK
ncbi:MAG: ACT domain-containing protein, partial [Gammaproteobacteria bacterium]